VSRQDSACAASDRKGLAGEHDGHRRGDESHQQPLLRGEEAPLEVLHPYADGLCREQGRAQKEDRPGPSAPADSERDAGDLHPKVLIETKSCPTRQKVLPDRTTWTFGPAAKMPLTSLLMWLSFTTIDIGVFEPM